MQGSKRLQASGSRKADWSPGVASTIRQTTRQIHLHRPLHQPRQQHVLMGTDTHLQGPSSTCPDPAQSICRQLGWTRSATAQQRLRLLHQILLAGALLSSASMAQLKHVVCRDSSPTIPAFAPDLQGPCISRSGFAWSASPQHSNLCLQAPQLAVPL